MRAVPGCAVQQQALAAEAAAVVRNAVSLARRRGHAQVTPLHVATAMLSSSPAPAAPGPGLLRAACLRSSSRSHPLQCKALELCFNVALNRLPTAFHGGGSPPALSNALVAAFKRAQAHHRRGESSSPAPVLAGHGGGTKVELEQLVVSILDDPSVSRVMREAGFSSALVKANVAVLELESTTPKPSPPSDHPHRAATRKLNNGGGGGIEDAMKMLECMASGQHRCLVAVDSGAGAGDDGGARAERAVKAVMDMVSKAELPRGQNYKQLACVQFVPLSVSSFRAAARAEVDAKAGELRGLAREAQRAGKGLVVVVQDLAWAADFWADTRSRSSRSCNGGSSSLQDDYYCPVEHAVMEVSGLVHEMRGGGGGGRFWMLGFASEAVFSRCRAGRPSLADVWGIHPVVFPGDGGLALSRSCFSGAGRPGWPPLVVINGAGEMSDEFTCCAGTWPEEPMSIIPPWLRRYHDPNLAAPPSSCGTDLQQDLWKPTMRSNGSSAARRHTSELTLSFSSPPPPSPAPAASDRNYYSKQQPWQSLDPQQQLQLHLRATTTPSPPECTSAQSSSSGGGCSRSRPRFTELTAENLKTLCTALEGPHVPPRCKDLAPAVASAVLQRRSGVTTRQRRRTTWLVFRGDDGEGKKAMAMELARLVFGSYADFACMRISISADHSVVVSPSSGEFVPATTTTLKRRRSRSPDDGRHGCACAQSMKLYEALRENPRRVIMVDGAEQLDINNGCIKEVIATGRMRCSSSTGNGGGGDSVGLEDAIVVLSFDDSRPRVKSQRVLIGDDEEEGGGGVGMEDGPAKKKKSPPSFSLDLNSCAAGDEEEETGNLVEDDDVEIGDDVDGVFFFQLPRDLSH